MTATAFSPVVTSVRALAGDIADRQQDQRLVVAIVGAPGSGKSTLAEELRAALVGSHARSAEVVPMDGFHFDNDILDAKGLRARKGAPNTFDVDGLAALLDRLSTSGRDVAIPVFDRNLDMTRSSARIIDRHVEVLLVEGNYLLLGQAPWDGLRQFFDLTIKIDCTRFELERRLMQRWLDLGLSEEVARAKVEGNDLLNADVIETLSQEADIQFKGSA